MRLALHGTTGVPDDLLRECIARGVTKVNVNKVYLRYYTPHLRAQAANLTLTKLLEEGVDQVQRGVETLLDVTMSSGKADEIMAQTHG
jgi:fructose-bisphosphate aldolase class II